MGKLWEHKKIIKLISEYNNITWVEIGVRFGNNIKYIIDTFDINKAYLIDPYVVLGYLPQHYGTNELVLDNFKQAKEKLIPYIDKIIWIKDFSHNAINKITDSIDILYIDGDHRYDAVMSDLELYCPKVRNGGLVIGDDFNECDVEHAINDFSIHHRIQFNISTGTDVASSDKFWFING